MSVKQKQIKASESVFDRELRTMIKNIIEEEYPSLQEEDVKKIISKLVPDLDELISKKIKQHLTELCKFLISKFDK